MVDGTIDPRSRGQNSVIGTIHGRPRPPIFGGPSTEHLSEYSGVLGDEGDLSKAPCKRVRNLHTKSLFNPLLDPITNPLNTQDGARTTSVVYIIQTLRKIPHCGFL